MERTTRPMMKQILRRWLFCLAVLVTLIALFYAEEDWRGAHVWEKFKHQCAARGENLDYSSFVPPPVPKDKNFAMTPIVASSYLSYIDKSGHERRPHDTNVVNRLRMPVEREDNRDTPTSDQWAQAKITDLRRWQEYYRAAVQKNREWPVATNEFPVASHEQSPAQDVLLALSKYDSAIEELREAAKLPDSRFPLEYNKDDPAAILLPHLAALESCSQMLQLRAIAELQLGQSDKAAADTQLTFQLIGASHNEPFLISHLVRIVMVHIALQSVYEGLAENKWLEVQLAALDSQLAKLDFLADYQHSMRSEAAFTDRMMAYLERTRDIGSYLELLNKREPRINYFFRLFPAGWFHRNQISLAKFYLQDCLPAVDAQKREFLPQVAKQAETNLQESMAHPNPDNLAMKALLSPLRQFTGGQDTLVRKFAYAQQSVDLARVAIALERFRLAHGKFPESLDLLAPQFMSEVPHDLIDGEPLKYHVTNGVFILYSVGWNEKDDGGTVAPKGSSGIDPDQGDWVWRYPAK